MANYVSGPIVAVMGTVEGVVVKARELLGAMFTRRETLEEGAEAPEGDHVMVSAVEENRHADT